MYLDIIGIAFYYINGSIVAIPINDNVFIVVIPLPCNGLYRAFYYIDSVI